MASASNRKVAFTSTFIKERLSIHRIPVANAKGQVVHFDDNPEGKRYVLFDAHRDAPVGFGVAVNRTNLSYILQRRIGDRVMKATIGNTRDLTLDGARDKAKQVLETMRETGRSPAENRELAEDDLVVARMTVAECYAMYRTHLANRSLPAKATSLKSLEQALRRLRRKEIGLADMRVGDLVGEKKIVEAFDTLRSSRRKLVDGTKKTKDTDAYNAPTITAAEQTFRWISRAVDYCMERERRVADNLNRPPSLRHNPFGILKAEGKFRSRLQLEKEYSDRSVRNPMQIRDGSLGRFLTVLWDRRKTRNYRTACDYLLLTLLWGMRRGEAAPLQWRHRITDQEAKSSSWLDLDRKLVHLHDTKNRFDHELPLAPAALRILRLRKEMERDTTQKWVFPARSSKAVQGHYLDSKSILDGLRDRGDIEELRPHDLRRTFSTVAEEMTTYAVVKRLLNHRNLRDVTERYPQVDAERLMEELSRIERAILMTAPSVAVALLPVDTPLTTAA